MKKTIITLLITLAMPMMTNAQTYTQLWKQVKTAEQQDLPKTQAEVLAKIVKKAEAEKAYGQLLKAELMQSKVMASVAPDSLEPTVKRLEQREQQTQDVALKAVFNAVLGYVYANNKSLSDDAEDISRQYYLQAMSHPEELAKVKAALYEPFVIVPQGSNRYFGGDLLNVIGNETNQFEALHAYYLTTDNRQAQLLTAISALSQESNKAEYGPLNKSAYIHSLDSLIERYGDLVEAGSAAVMRYQHMDKYTDATTEQKMQYINMALERWGDWNTMNILRNAQRELTALQFSAHAEHEVWLPQREQKVQLSGLRGISQLTMKVYSVKGHGDIEERPNTKDGYKKLKPLLTLLPFQVSHQYVGKKDYEIFEDSMTIAALPAGVYMLEFESTPSTAEPVRMLYFVSDVRVLVQALPAGQIRYVCVNATTGQPIQGAKLKLMTGYGGHKVLATLTTDQKGEGIYQMKGNERPTMIYAYTSDDKACMPMNAYGYFNYNDRDNRTEQAVVYTDRAIYRPGQTVHAAAIFYETAHHVEHQAIKGRKVTMQLRDANYKVVAEQQVATDDFGTCSADFTLPSSGLTGRFTVHANGYSQGIRVEEYKRPTFQVEFPEVNQSYDDGDTVVVRATARTYAGVPVQGAKVSYKVVRRRAFWWWSYSSYWNRGYIGTSSEDEEVASGETVTESDGTFAVEMPMILPKTKYPMFYNFVVTADVTDQAGESHQGNFSLPLGNRKTAFSIDLSDKMLAEGKNSVGFYLRNAAGNNIEAQVKYRIDNGKWQTTSTQKSATIPQLKSGKHTITAICEKDTLTRDFIVFSLEDKRPAAGTDDWFYVSDYTFPRDGKPVTIQVGSSAEDVHIVYTIISGDKVLESGAVDKSNELINRKFSYKEEYGNGVLLTYAWVREGQTYVHSVSLMKPLPAKVLMLKWQTFRDRLTPGQQEEWTLSVVKPDGEPADAQLMATLYDKSLDQIVSHGWSLSPTMWLPMPSTEWLYAQWGGMGGTGYKRQDHLSYTTPNHYGYFDHSVYPVRSYALMGRIAGYSGARLRGNGVMMAKATSVMDDGVVVVEEAPMMAMAQKETAEEVELSVLADNAAGTDEEQQTTEVQLRENLQETAFFYPQVVADSTGIVSLKFTLPESLTTWRFMSIAHTKDMMHGTLTGEAVAKKDVMIQPNMPRFVREGDLATISARVFNTSEEEVNGTARLQLIDPETEQVVFDERQKAVVGANGTTSVSFQYKPDGRQQLLIAKMSISGKNFSDGEQHYLPILPNRERVTVTVPFTQNAPGTKTIDLQQLVPVEEGKLTIEYTNNPAWLMIQALPTVGHPHDDCAICQAASFYANALGRYILKQNPQAKTVFEQWKREDSQLSTLNSQLQKNQELKELLLDNTPWVLDADRETEQRQRLADFFDENLMQQRLASAIKIMEKLQNGDGSWSWWPGMRGSLYMTVSISEMMARLNQMAGEQSETKKMLDKAFRFMNKEILEEVKEMKKLEKKGYKQSFPSFTALQYLYICTIDGRKQNGEVQEAHNYLKKLLKKERKGQTMYEKALSAIILNSTQYVKSLKEYTVYREDMGRYYDTPRASYSWRDYRIPTQTMAIEAMQRLTPQDTQTITEMQRWLLQEKRTQAWDTPINSVDAVYAFLNGRPEVLQAQPATKLAIDGKELETSKATAGVGYVKTSVSSKGTKTFTAEKTSEGTSWGAVYAQFMQKTSDVADQTESGIVVKREIISGNNRKVGDRVKVRITITTDRDLDFVQVIDRRAACLEPVNQLSGYHWGYYCTPRDQSTNYYYDLMPKGKHVLETEYYIDREGEYQTGTCVVQCAYAPEFRGLTKSQTIIVK